MGKPSPPAQTPMALLLGGSDSQAFKDCAAALASCGFPPLAFGSYNDVKKAQQACRSALGLSKFKPSAALKAQVAALPDETKKFMAEGEAGHMATNALFKQPGGRTDSCANLPGCAGYDTNTAATTVHQGDSRTRGTPHGEITQDEKADAAAQAGQNGAPPGQLNEQGVQNCVQGSATTACGGVNPRGDGSTFDQNAAAMKKNQEDSAAALQGKDGGGATTAGGGASDGTGASGSNASPTKPQGGGDGAAAALDKAIECSKEIWKKQSDKARKDFCDQNRTVGKPAPATPLGPDGKPIPPDQASSAAANKMMSEDPPRDPNSTPPGAPMDPDAAKAAIKANQTACSQEQANYLAQFYDAGKDPPPYSGMTPGNTGTGGSADADPGGD